MISSMRSGYTPSTSASSSSSTYIDVSSSLVPTLFHYTADINRNKIIHFLATTATPTTTTTTPTSCMPSPSLSSSLFNKNSLNPIWTTIEHSSKSVMAPSASSAIMAIATATVTTTAYTKATEANLHKIQFHGRNISLPSSSIVEANLITTTTLRHEIVHSASNTSSTLSVSGASAAIVGTSSSSSPSPLPSSLAYSTVHCPTTYHNLTLPKTELYCNWTWDKFLCWPPTEAGKIAHLPCPPGHGIDITKFAERRCGWDGRWEGKSGATLPQDTTHTNGWTNYTPCYTPEILELMKKVYAGGNGEVVKIKFDIVERTRTLEIIGLMLSLCALLLSLIIFCNFRSLRNNRTRIHKNLFVAMVIQVLIRLTLYLDQAIIRRGHEIAGNGSANGIENTPYLCEASYIFLEYAGTAMFMWMFIEGLYLHNVITVTVFQGRFPHTLYIVIGWGGPMVMTAIWAFVTARHKGQEKCWWNYNLTPYYWILEGPRLAVILFNFFFLLNIIRVLVVKLRQSHTSDVEQVRKAVRAAVVLLPLLGITNLLHMTEAPLDKTAWEFALWSYITHFLRSFQGLFIAMIYCFLNGEVRAALMKSLSVYMSIHGHPNWAPRRASMFSAAYNTAPETEGQCNESTYRRESSTNRTQHNNYNRGSRSSWMMALCFRGQKNECVMSDNHPTSSMVMTTKIC